MIELIRWDPLEFGRVDGMPLQWPLGLSADLTV
jgi:hypothetical protein